LIPEVEALNILLHDSESDFTSAASKGRTQSSLITESQRLLFQLVTLRALSSVESPASFLFKEVSQENAQDSLRRIGAYVTSLGVRGSAISELFAPTSFSFSQDSIQKAWSLLAECTPPAKSQQQERYSLLEFFSFSLSRIVGYEPIVKRSQALTHIEFVSSAMGKRASGTYFTPLDMARRITKDCIDRVVKRRLQAAGITIPDISSEGLRAFSKSDREAARKIIMKTTVLDPACGTGSMLVAAAELLSVYLQATTPEVTGGRYADAGLQQVVFSCLYGVDKNPLALLLTKVILWSISGQSPKNDHFRSGDSLLGPVSSPRSPANWPHSFDEAIHWSESFRREIGEGGFSVVVTNPPWDRVKVMEREILSTNGMTTPETTYSRGELLHSASKDVQEQLQLSKERVKQVAERIRRSEDYTWASKGELNLYKLFAERALILTAGDGCCGLIVPTGIATDYSARDFLWALLQKGQLASLYDFENRRKIFHAVDGRFRFCLLTLDKAGGIRRPRFEFFAQSTRDLDAKGQSFTMSISDISKLSPLTRTPPVVRSKEDFLLLKKLSEPHQLMMSIAEKWRLRYMRMVDMSNDSDQFSKFDDYQRGNTEPDGTLNLSGRRWLRVYEGKMISRYNHRAASAVTRNGAIHRPGGSRPASLSELGDASFTVASRFYVPEDLVLNRVGGYPYRWFLGYKDITSATNERTMIATVLPFAAVGNKIPLLLCTRPAREVACLLANLNSFVYDFICRQKIGNITLNWYIVKQTAICAPELYNQIHIDGQSLLEWISSRVASLTYTSHDMRNWGLDLGFSKEPYPWELERRRRSSVELDALFFVLYGATKKEAFHILDTFPIIRSDETKKYGSYLLAQQITDAMTGIRQKLTNQLDNAAPIESSI